MTESLALVVTTVISVTGALVSVFYAHASSGSPGRGGGPLAYGSVNLSSKPPSTCSPGCTTSSARTSWTTSSSARPAVRRSVAYTVLDTAYLIGQYLGWVGGVIRRESQYIDPRSRSATARSWSGSSASATPTAESRELKDPTLRLFRGEQRAIGEVMLVPTDSTTVRVPRWEYKGYARFIDEHDVTRSSGGSSHRERRRDAGQEPHKDHERLVQLQHELMTSSRSWTRSPSTYPHTSDNASSHARREEQPWPVRRTRSSMTMSSGSLSKAA